MCDRCDREDCIGRCISCSATVEVSYPRWSEDRYEVSKQRMIDDLAYIAKSVTEDLPEIQPNTLFLGPLGWKAWKAWAGYVYRQLHDNCMY